jgi:hypothetical protein
MDRAFLSSLDGPLPFRLELVVVSVGKLQLKDFEV